MAMAAASPPDDSEETDLAERRLKMFTAFLFKPQNISRLRSLEKGVNAGSTPAAEDEKTDWEKLLPEFSFEVVSSYNIQFSQVIGLDTSGNEEKMIISQLADEAVSRILSQAITPTEVKDLTKAFLNGKNTNAKDLILKERELEEDKTLIKKKKVITAACLFDRPSIFCEGRERKKYRSKNYKNDEKQSWMFHRHPLPHEEETDFTEPVDQTLEDINATDLYQQIQDKKADLLKALHEDLHDDTKRLEIAKRRMKLFTGILWDNMKHNIEDTIKQANNSAYVPVSTKTKVAAFGVDKALDVALMFAPIPGIGAKAAKLGKKAVFAGGKKLAEKQEQNLGAKGAKNVAEQIPDFKHSEGEIKKILIAFAFEVVTSYNVQFCEVIDCSDGREEKLMLKLADEVIGRIFSSLSEAKAQDPIKEVKDLVKPFLDGKNPSPRDIEPREFKDTLFRNTDNTGMTTSDIFKRPGIYLDGKVHVRKKYENDEKQTRMYHRHPLPGEHWEDSKDLAELDKEPVNDLFEKLQAMKEDLLKNLGKHLTDDHEKTIHTIEEVGETIMGALKNLDKKVDETEHRKVVELLADLFKTLRVNDQQTNRNIADLGKKLNQTMLDDGKIDDLKEHLKELSKQLAEISKITLSPVVANTVSGDNRGNHQNVVGDHNIQIMNIEGQVNMTVYNNPGEKSKNTSDKKLPSLVRDYKQFLSETENTTLRTKLDQLQVGSKKYLLQRKFSKKGSESITNSELLRNIPRSKTSLVSGPSGSGKSTLAANITVDWAESEDASYEVVLFLSSLHKKVNLPLHKLLWGEFAGGIGKDTEEIYQELLERKGKILVIIDGLGMNQLKFAQ